MRVVVTGMSVWCSIARTLDAFERALRNGCSGRRRVTRISVTDPVYRTRDAAVLIDEERLDWADPEHTLERMALIVARQALDDAELSLDHVARNRAGVALGTSHGGNLALVEFVRGRLAHPAGGLRPGLALAAVSNVVGGIAAALEVTGPVVTVSTACASSTNAIGRAMELIRLGRADVMIAGGADLFGELSFSGFNILGALARGPCRPLDRDRDGMMLGDGAAFVVLESEAHARARGARVYTEVAGHAIVNDALHPTAPDASGGAPARVMRDALTSAGVDPADVDYINVHGTGTLTNDISEMKGIAQVFGARARSIPISATKSLVGHTLGAAGSVEFVASALAVAHSFAPPSINFQTPMEGFEDWRYIRDRSTPMRIRVALSNSFAFAGNLASIVLTEPGFAGKAVQETP